MSSSDDSRARARAEARKLLIWHLGLADASIPDLVRLAHETLGGPCATLAIERTRQVRVTRRKYALSNLAALIVGTRRLGRTWWHQARERSWFRDHEFRTPGQLLAEAPTPEQHEFPLNALDYWIRDDVADAIWGPSVAFVDLNSQRIEDRFLLPPNAREGDRYVLSFDPGDRVDATLVRRGETLGSNLELDTVRWSSPTEAWWAWAALSPVGPLVLPGEEERSVYDEPVDPVSTAQLREWAIAHHLPERTPKWATVGDVVAAIDASECEHRFGTHDWVCAASALADGDASELRRALDRLRQQQRM